MSVIWVACQVVGWHNWADAPAHRAYLAHPHRHVFHVKVTIPVEHDDREVEFHDLLDWVHRQGLEVIGPGGQFGGQSCETIAARLADLVQREYGRACEVEVSEDGECGAIVDTPAPG